jgi:superfamily II DNA or RNA helicase
VQHHPPFQLVDIKQKIGGFSFVRAEGYYSQGRVGSIQFEENYLSAEVQGTQRKPYLAKIFTEKKGFFSVCSCPMMTDCKHVGALAIKAVSEWGSVQNGKGIDSRSPEWSDVLSKLIDQPSFHEDVRAEIQILFQWTESENTSSPLKVRPCIFYPAEQKTSMTEITWKDCFYDYSRRFDFVSRSQSWYLRQWAQILCTSYHDRSPWLPISHKKAFEAWHLLLDHKKAGVRLFFGSKSQKKECAVDTQKDVTMKVILSDENGGVRLEGNIVLGDENVSQDCVEFFGDPPVFALLLAQKKFYQSSHEYFYAPLSFHPVKFISKNTLENLTGKPLFIPDKQIPSFVNEFAPKLVRDYTVENKSSRVILPARIYPKAVIDVKKIDAQSLKVSLSWLYGEKRVPYEDAINSFGLLEYSLRKMLEENLSSLPSFWMQASSSDRGRLKSQADLFWADAVYFVKEILPKLLLLQDVEVKRHGEIPDFVYDNGEASAEFSIEESMQKEDWFDLHTGIKIGDRTVAFEKIFSALAAKQEYLFLENGHYFSLNTPFFDRLRQLIERSDSLVSWNKEKIQLTRYQAGWWGELQKLGIVKSQSLRWNESLRGVLDHASIALEEPPPLFKGTLRSYQAEGVAWMRFLHAKHLGGVLADDMGLGKTVQTLAFVAACCHEKKIGSEKTPVLIVAPTSVVENWDAEISHFVPSLEKIIMRSGDRSASLARLQHADIVVTSYALLARDKEHFEKIHWDAIVVDEAQFVKNHQSRAYSIVRSLKGVTKIALTGTPMENNLMELWSIFSIACPGLFVSPEKFKEFFQRPIERDNQPQALKLLRSCIRPFILRRTKENVESQLPPKTEQTLCLSMNDEQRKIYDLALQKERKRVLGLLEEGGLKKHRFEILTALMRMRQLCLHPGLVDKKYSKIPSEKIDALLDQLEVLLAENHRVLIFSQFTSFLSLIKKRLDKVKVKYLYLDGATKNRKEVLGDFSKDSSYPVFLISLKAGGMGLNLTSADYCILMDPWWNPAVEAQAVDRTHRIGQTKPVMVYRMIAQDTIEEKVVKLQEKKKMLFKNVLDEGEIFSKLVTDEDIKNIFESEFVEPQSRSKSEIAARFQRSQ